MNEFDCFVCGEKGVRSLTGYFFCQSCYDKMDGKIIVYCVAEGCGKGFGIIDNTPDNVHKICVVNSISKLDGKVNEISYNIFLNTAINIQQRVFCIKHCPHCVMT